MTDKTTDKTSIVADEQATYRIGVTEYPRIRYGDETTGGITDWHLDRNGKPKRCGDCNVAVGEYHQPGCDVEQCPRCKGQSIGCDCDSETLPELHEAYERLRVDNAALREIALAVANGDVTHDSQGGLLIVAQPDALVTQARALLADTLAKGDGDHE